MVKPTHPLLGTLLRPPFPLGVDDDATTTAAIIIIIICWITRLLDNSLASPSSHLNLNPPGNPL